MVQARAGIIELAGVGGGQFAQGLRQFARQSPQALHHGLGAPGGDGVQFPAPARLVALFQGIERVLQLLHQGRTGGTHIGDGIHQAAAPRRSKILPSFSSSVCAVNGLMM